jgi:hypothetical protein
VTERRAENDADESNASTNSPDDGRGRFVRRGRRGPADSSDVVTVATVTANDNGGPIDVPVYIRDTAGTPLGIDQPFGSRIQSYSIQVLYSPAAAVQSITFTRGGITAPLTPTFENSPAVPACRSRSSTTSTSRRT